jgi:4-aminobutyrate aminotransferase-like enzyme
MLINMSPSAVLEATIAEDVSIVPSRLATGATPLIPLNDGDPGQSTEPALLHRSLIERPHNVKSASGIYLNLRDGRRIVDACGGAAVAIIGHGNEEVIKATMTPMMKVSYVHSVIYTTDAAEGLADFVLEGNKCKCCLSPTQIDD